MDDITGLTDLIMPLINQVGFPIFVAVYLLRLKAKQDHYQQKLIDEIKCIQGSLLETKLQIGEKVTK